MQRVVVEVKLNLGCGYDIREGYVNVDLFVDHPDVVNNIDLERLPLPFPDGCADEILLLDVLEHLWVNPYKFMLEIYRLLVDGGVVVVELPFFHPVVGHVRCVHTREYFKTLTEENISMGQHKNLFDEVSCRYRFGHASRRFPFFHFHVRWVLRSNGGDFDV